MQRLPPNVIHLSGDKTLVGTNAASGTVLPGHLVELNTAGRSQVHSTPGGQAQKAVALNQDMLNRGVDIAYIDGDLMEVGVLEAGATAWMLIPSGQNITDGDKLESAGDGRLRAVTNGEPLFMAIEDVDNSAGPSDARIRVEAL